MLKSRRMLVTISGNMVQFMPSGKFFTWAKAEERGAPEWVGHFLKYKEFNLNKEVSIKRVQENYIIEQAK